MANKTLPQGYKDSPLGIIPKEWEVKRLGDYVDIISGESPSLYDLRTTGTYPYVKVEDMNNCTKYQIESREYSNSQRNIVPKGSIIFPKRGAAILNNKVRIAYQDILMDSNMMAITPKTQGVDSEFLYYTIIKEQLYKIADTSTIPQINNKHILPYRFCFPPIEQQKKICSVLQLWDTAIEKQSEMIEKLKLRKRALMQQLLTGKKRLPGFSGEWRKIKAGELFTSSSIKGNPDEVLLSATQEYGVIPRDQLEGRVTMPKGNLGSFKLVEEGDFVISLRSFQGGIEYSKYRGIVSPAYNVLKPIIEIDKAFYQFYFKSSDFIRHLAVAVIGIRDGKQISYEDFCFVKIPYPRIEEQKAISAILIQAEKEIELANEKLICLQSQKRGLMQQLLTGKIRTTNFE